MADPSRAEPIGSISQADPSLAVRPYVVKLGGALLDDAALVETIWTAIGALREQAPIVVVHGGGKQATALAHRLGHEPRIVQGRRVTSDLDLDLVQWTMRGGVNGTLAAAAVRHGIPAAGISGIDGGTLRVHKRPPWQVNGETVDFGWVGDVDGVEPHLLQCLIRGGFVPIVAPLGVDTNGQVYNVNADTVALALAEALNASRFLLVTDRGGVQRDLDRPDSVLASCDPTTYERGLAEGWIAGGMRVKLKVAFDALEAGIPDVRIVGAHDLTAQNHCTRVVA
jgi:acetylglutamate kinase